MYEVKRRLWKSPFLHCVVDHEVNVVRGPAQVLLELSTQNRKQQCGKSSAYRHEAVFMQTHQLGWMGDRSVPTTSASGYASAISMAQIPRRAQTG